MTEKALLIKAVHLIMDFVDTDVHALPFQDQGTWAENHYDIFQKFLRENNLKGRYDCTRQAF